MFGYVRAIPDVLPPEEASRYEAVYCGLCADLGARYGWTARFILNYDFVFLALLLAPGEGTDCRCRICPARPWKRRTCWMGGPALEIAADESLILTWWKLKDSLRDGRWWERLAARTAMAFLRGHYRAAAALRPDFDRTVAECLDELHAMEAQALPSLDRPADTFARILQSAASETHPAARATATAQILYHVGRWIYLADAWDDREDDARTGSYNPVLALFGETPETGKDRLRETMHTSLGLARTALALVDWDVWEPLLDHILGTGLPAVEEAVFTGQWKQRNKHRRSVGGPTDRKNKELESQ